MTLIVGSYATPPRPLGGSDEFRILSAGALTLDGVDGLEIPYIGAASPWQDAAWVRSTGATHVVTTVPAMMSAIETDPHFGLASADDDARAAAVRLIGDVRTFVAAVTQDAGVKVGTVLLHSAPGMGHSTADAFARSLDEIAGWDWADAGLAVEHCDALVPAHDPVKGFLRLEDELPLVASRGIGITINWGRSAIETHSADGPADHLAAAAEQGVLTGLMFSGAAATAGPYGDAWADKHLPIRGWGIGALSDAADASVLTRSEVERCVGIARRASTLEYVGVKVKAPPASAPDRWLDVVGGNLAVLRDVLGA